MLGDTAIAVHPDDERYATRRPARSAIPFLDRTFPIVADDYVDPSSAPARSRSRRRTTRTTTRSGSVTASR
jgi:hypothetical protein